MKKMRSLPTGKKMLICLAVLILAVYCIWAMSGYPLFSRCGELRRQEQAYLLPKGKILSVVKTEANGPDFVIAENAEIIEVCRMPSHSILADYDAGMFLYERTCEQAAVILPSRIYGQSNGGIKGCVLLFSNNADTNAELTFDVGGESISASGNKAADGLYVLYFDAPETEALYELTSGRAFDVECVRCSLDGQTPELAKILSKPNR